MTLPTALVDFIALFATAFDAVGVLIVLWGGALAVIEVVRIEVTHFGKDGRRHFVEKLRVDFGQKIVFGLEFFIAGDIIRLITTPSGVGSQEVLLRVGVIVVLRTILAYFLSKEIDKHK